jgi:hypothetical protein
MKFRWAPESPERTDSGLHFIYVKTPKQESKEQQ